MNKSDNATVDGVAGQNGWQLAISWVNVGKSPAVRVSTCIEYKVIEQTAVIPSFGMEVVSGSKAIVGQNKIASTNEVFITQDDVANVISNSKQVWIYSKIEYFSVFNSGLSRVSEVCGRLMYKGQAVARDGTVHMRWTIGVAGPQNTCT